MNLAAEMVRLPEPPDGGSAWDRRRRELRERILTGPPEHFLRWPTVESTMFVGNAPYIDIELSALTSEHIDAIQETGVGSPIRYSSYTSGNLIHQAYHLAQWQRVTGQSVRGLQRIVEVGAGYGAMALIVKRLGFRGHYQIIDLPEFALLQQWYLGETLGDIECFSWSSAPTSCDLLIACHSLSEMAIAERDQILENFPASSYLFVYHCEHEGVDNLSYFSEWGEGWRQWVTEHLPNQVYRIR